MKILGVVGARPNFVKMAPVFAALERRPGVDAFLVHTGQHFDREMSEVFFGQLGLPEPRVNLGVGPFSPWAQTGRIVEALGEIVERERPDWVLVPGDVNSTLAAAVASIRAGGRLAHLEAGLRSFDRSMPEELNRIAVDHLADRLYVTEPSGLKNLDAEGVSSGRVRFVGNTMVDTLLRSRELAARSEVAGRLGLLPREPYILMTMHRPETVDTTAGLARLVEIVRHAAGRARLVFPVHPRTRKRLVGSALLPLLEDLEGLTLSAPLGYLDFLALMTGARVVMTDSGGIQEETTALGVACLTLRNATERPATCEVGTNRLAGTDPVEVGRLLDEVWLRPPTGARPEGWDGRAGERVARDLVSDAREA